MQDDLLNILKNNNRNIDNQKLMDYVNGRLSPEEKHEVEKWMIDEPFFSEAAEGLQEVGSEKAVTKSVEQINSQLRLYLRERKNKKRIRKLLPITFWTYVAIVVILLIAVITWVIVNRINGS